jgi:hypothetical protein
MCFWLGLPSPAARGEEPPAAGPVLSYWGGREIFKVEDTAGLSTSAFIKNIN